LSFPFIVCNLFELFVIAEAKTVAQPLLTQDSLNTMFGSMLSEKY